MRSYAVIVFAIVALAVGKTRAGDEPESLFAEAMRHMNGCAENIELDMSLCCKLLEDETDRSDPKYDNCKAMGVCLSERFGVMVGNDFDYAKMEEQKKRITTDEYKAEADKVLTKCKGTPVGVGQKESMMNMATCALEASPKFKEIVTGIAKSFSGDSD